MTNLTDNLTKEIRASSLDQDRPSWLVGFVNEQYFFLRPDKKRTYFNSIFTYNSDHEHLILEAPGPPRVKSIELHLFYAANNVDHFTLEILAAAPSPSSHYWPCRGWSQYLARQRVILKLHRDLT